ncbi:hypothetical protein LOTGIDRAFT_174169, partial [Lottia gigantea]
LEEFGDAANGYPEYTDYDIVKDYIEVSPDCSQIFHLIDGKTLKSAEVSKIFRVFECILLRTGDDLAEKYGHVGEGIVSHICGVNSKQIYLALNIRNKPNQLKSTIKLLTSMVLQGETSALCVLDLFEEKNIGSLIPLFTHKNISDNEDVRTCVIYFIISFLLSGSNTLIRQLLKKTELVQNVFYDISHDKLELIEMILQIFHEKILENQGINKSTKVGIFNGRILHELTQLYYWCGPQKWRDSKSSKHGEVQDTASEEDKLTVIDLVHHFLSTLCCSFKHGIAFFDKTVGTGKRNHNITLSKMLSSLQHPYNHSKLKLLVIQILKECPDLLQHYLPLFNHALLPRPTPEWLKCINFILEIYENQTTSPNLQYLEDVTINNVVTIATTYFIPPEIIRKTLANGLKNESMVVRHKTIELYRFILNRGVTLIRSGESSPDKLPVDVREYRKQLIDTIIKMIPTVNMMMSCWNKTVNPQKSHKKYTQSAALPNISATEHLILIEQFLCLNQQLVPDLIDRHPVILATLLDGISKITGGQDEQNGDSNVDETVIENGQEDNNDETMDVGDESQEIKMADKADDNKMDVDWENEDDDQKAILQLYLLKIISDSDSRLLPWKRKGKNKKSLMFQLLNVLSGPASLAKTTRQLISKMLRGTGAFESENGELDIWLKHATPSNKHTSYLPVLAQILNRYISNYSNHQDKLTEILSSDKNNFPFTPLLMVAMEMIKKKEDNSEDIKEFIVRVVPSIYHIQSETKALQPLFATYSDQLKGVKYWKPPKKSNCDFHPVSILMMSLPGDSKTVEDVEDEIIRGMVTMDTDELVLFSRQILLYLGEAILQFSQNPIVYEKTINFYFKLLQKILADVKTKMATVTSSESDGKTDMEKQTKTFGDFCESENSEKIVLKHILLNKYLQTSFLDCVNSKNEISVSQIISPPLLLIIEKSSSCLDTEELEKLKYSYTDKIFQNLKVTGKLSNHEAIVKCLRSLIPHLNEKYRTRFIDVILGLSDSFIVSKKRREITDAGKLVIQILSEKLQTEFTLLHQLSLAQTSKLLNCLKLAEDDNLIKFCSELLGKNPAFSLACDEELWLHLLENDTDKMSDVMVKLYDNNYVCRTSFQTWMLESGDFSKNKWCITVRNSEELISLVYTNSNILPKISQAVDRTDIDIIKQLVNSEKYGKKEMIKMWKFLSESMLETGVVNSHRLDLLQTLFNKLVTIDTTYREKLVILCFRILLMKSLDENIKFSLLDLISENIKMCNKVHLEDLEEIWPQFVKSSLRTMYLEPKLINILIDCIPLVYYKSHDQKLPIKFLYDMVMSHSKFLAVMFGEKSQEIKGSMITLLLSIAEISTDCYDSNNIRIFLGIYTASLSLSDQKLLKLISLYENNSTVDLNQYQPFLFGQKALDFYSSKKYQAPSILRETKMADLIDCLDESLLLKSALNFPLYRGLVPSEVKKVDKIGGNEDCYDPCFLLPVFNQLLQPGVIVDLKQFITSNCLGFVLAGLSSHVTSVRQACYLILKQYYDRLSTATFPEVEEIKYLLELLRGSIETPSMKLCTVITVFLSKMAKLLLSPENHMYKSLTTFLMSKPTLEFDRIPGFYRFFNSSELDHHQERQWMLNMILDGLRTYDDFRIYETLYSFKLLQSYYQSLLSDLHSQTIILKIINSVCIDIETITVLYEKHGILTWFLGVILQLKPGSCHVTLITEIFHNIWFTIQSQLPTDSLVNIPIQFLYQIIQCLRHLITKLGSEDAVSFHKIMKVLSSTLKYFKIVQHDTHLFLMKFDNLALKDIAMILLCLGKFNNDIVMFHQAQHLLTSINVDVMKLLPSAVAAAAAVKKWQPSNPTNNNEDKFGTKSENLKLEPEEKSIKNGDRKLNHSLDLQAMYKKVKVNQTENVSELIEIFLTWNPGKDVDDGTTSAAGFLLVMTYLMDNCTKVKDKQLILKILDWLGSVMFRNKSQNGGFVIFDDKNFSKMCRSVLTADDDFIRKITDKLLFLYSYGNILSDNKQNIDTKIGSKSQSSDPKSENSSDLRSKDMNFSDEKDSRKENSNDDLKELINCGLIGKLNKILMLLMEISIEKSEDKTRKIWKKSLKRVRKVENEEKDNLTTVLIQEYFLGVDQPETFDKLYKTCSLKTGDVTMDTSIIGT